MDCLVAGVLTSTGATSELIDTWRDGAFEIIVSPRLLTELRDTLRKPRIARRYPAAAAHGAALAAELEATALRVDDPEDATHYVPDDPNDDYLVALALASRADALVTRDRHFRGVRVPGLRIITPGELLRELSTSKTL